MESGLPRVQPRHFLRHRHRRIHRLRRSDPTAADIFAASGRQPIRAREQKQEIPAHPRGCCCNGMCGPHPGDLCRGRNLEHRWTHAGWTRGGVLSEGRSRHRQEASCTDEYRFFLPGQASMRSVQVAVHMWHVPCSIFVLLWPSFPQLFSVYHSVYSASMVLLFTIACSFLASLQTFFYWTKTRPHYGEIFVYISLAGVSIVYSLPRESLSLVVSETHVCRLSTLSRHTHIAQCLTV